MSGRLSSVETKGKLILMHSLIRHDNSFGSNASASVRQQYVREVCIYYYFSSHSGSHAAGKRCGGTHCSEVDVVRLDTRTVSVSSSLLGKFARGQFDGVQSLPTT